MPTSQIIESLAAATGLARQTIRDGFSAVEATFGDRLSVMRQRVGGIVANASIGGDGGLDDVVAYTDQTVTRADMAKLFMGGVLGFVGGLLLSEAAGSFIVILVAIALLAAAGFLVAKFLMALMKRATQAIDLI